LGERPAVQPRSFNIADVFESVADRVADRTALVVDADRWTYAELDEQANRFACCLASLGVGAGDFVAFHSQNRMEAVAGMLGSYKVRAVPVVTNYRSSAPELAHLLEDCAASLLVVSEETAPVARGALSRMKRRPEVLEQGSSLAEALAAASPERPEADRSGDDLYVIYTGGTTGPPKGVVWRHEDAFFCCLGGADPTQAEGPVATPAELPTRIVQWPLRLMTFAPLAHAAGQWTALMTLSVGGTIVLCSGPLDPVEGWRAVEREMVTSMTVVGDAMGLPMIETWERHPGRFDASSLVSISSGGAPMSTAVRRRFAQAFPNVLLINGYGSSEAGTRGTSRVLGSDRERDGGQLDSVGRGVAVVDDEGRPVEPGSGAVGRLLATGRLPIGYLNDPVKTAETFVELGGRRHVVTGDFATVTSDGLIELRGRGSLCVNTGGEKVFVEEVEEVLRGHGAVADVVVVGVPDPRWGSAVTAVVAPRGSPPTLEELRAHAKDVLAGYKLPKHLVLVERVRRSPAGKADYPWARSLAAAEVCGKSGGTAGGPGSRDEGHEAGMPGGLGSRGARRADADT
jgi:acyl-CoA synthetase (AMP-forming)/AMP-acid ligase II